MSILGKIASGKRRASYSDNTGWLFDWLTGGNKSASGISVGPDSAQQSSAVHACVTVRSQDVAKLPCILYKREKDGSRRRAIEHRLYNLVGLKPNARQTSYGWRQMMQASFDLRGNAYSRIIRDARFRPVELVPLHDDWVTPVRAADGTGFYKVRMFGRGAEEILTEDDMLHIRDRSDDGFVGKSCISRARDVIGLDLAGSRHISKLFANGARPGGMLIPKGKVGKPGRDVIKAEWNDEFGGVENTNKVFVGGEDWTYTPVAMNNVDAEFLENRKMTRQEIASLFRVPPHKIGIMDNATFSNIEHQALEYVTDTLHPIAECWEQELNVSLLRESEQSEYYFEFLFDALLRGDFLSRMQGYAIQRTQLGRSYNDIAGGENWERVSKEDGGDERLVPLNMRVMGQPIPEKAAADPAPANKSLPELPDNVLRLPAAGAHSDA